MAVGSGKTLGLKGLVRWEGWFAQRRAIDLAATDMRDRYGPAAFLIAHNSAQRGGERYRRFWRQVARRLRGGVQVAEDRA